MTETMRSASIRDSPEPPFQVNLTQIADDVLTVEIIGGLDGHTAPLFDTAMVPLIAEQPARLAAFVRVELSALTFLDTAGLDALQEAVVALEKAGAQVDLVGACRRVRWLFGFAAQHCWLTAGPILAAAAS